MLKNFYGWSYLTWKHPFEKAVNGLMPATVLEIGASETSAISLHFSDSAKMITITSYPEIQACKTETHWKQFYTSNLNIEFKPMSIHEVCGKYDLILMKSVLGGICRNRESDYHHKIINQLVTDNLNVGGRLLTLDNGRSLLEPMLKSFGSRANNWRFYQPKDFKNFEKQYVFGVFSAFSLQSRLGWIGQQFDSLIYLVDRFFGLFLKDLSPTVIVTVYHKP